MSIRTDLAVEITENNNYKGVTSKKSTKSDLTVTEIEIISEEAARQIGKPKGKYITLTSDTTLNTHSDQFYERARVLSEVITELINGAENILVVGLGNREITPDRLGVDTSEHIFATRHIHNLAPDLVTENMSKVSVLSPGVMGETGIETAEAVGAIVKSVSPDAVIAVDSLACAELDNLAKTIQLTDTGISPGSGVQNSRAELSKSTLGVPTIAIGVPTVVDMQTIAEHIFKQKADKSYRSLSVAPKDIDRIISRASKLISSGINLALFPSLTLEEINSLVE